MRNQFIAAPMAFAMMVALSGTSRSSEVNGPFSADQRRAVETIVREYLLQNPGILRDVSAELDRRSEESQKATLIKAIAEVHDSLVATRGSTILGNPNGKVTLIAFFDYNCPFCKASVDDLQALIEANADLKIVLREFPILGPQSTETSRVALAAARQMLLPEVRAKYYRALMKAKGQMAGELALSIGEKFGLDRGRAQRDLHDKDLDQMISENIAIAEKLGINGTPSFIVGDQLIVGAVGPDKIQSAIARSSR